MGRELIFLEHFSASTWNAIFIRCVCKCKLGVCDLRGKLPSHVYREMAICADNAPKSKEIFRSNMVREMLCRKNSKNLHTRSLLKEGLFTKLWCYFYAGRAILPRTWNAKTFFRILAWEWNRLWTRYTEIQCVSILQTRQRSTTLLLSNMADRL